MSVIFQKHMPEAFFEILLFWPTICRGYFGPILYFHISNRFKAWTLKARFLGENILIGAAKVGAGRQRHSGPFSIWCQICRRGFRHQRGFRRHRHRVPYGQCHWSADPLIHWSTGCLMASATDPNQRGHSRWNRLSYLFKWPCMRR